MWSMEPITTVSDNVAAFAALSDDELVERVKHFAACGRRASVGLIRSLAWDEWEASVTVISRAARYSVRSATIGSTRDARRAGR